MTEHNHPTFNSQPNAPKDEFDMVEFIFNLWKNKFTIAIISLICILICIAYLFFAKEKWTSTAVVTQPSAGQVANYNAALSILYGQTPTDKPSVIDLQKQLFARFTASMNALSISLSNLEVPLTLKVDQLNKGSDDVITVSFVAPTAKKAQEDLTSYISKINENVVEDYGNDIKRNLSVKARELSNILDVHKQTAINKKKHRIDVMKQALIIAKASGIKQSSLTQADYLSDDTLYLLGSDSLQAMIENEKTKPLTFDDDYYSAERALLGVTHLKIDIENLSSLRFISKADLPLRRDSPKRGLLLVLSLFLGLILGTSIVIVRNIFTSYKKLH